MPDDISNDKPKLDIDWVRTVAGALAAVSSAVLLSTLGAAGTLIGAALGSVTLTITGALYSQGLARSRQKLVAAQELAQQKVGAAQSEVRRAARVDDQAAADAHLARAEDELDEAQDDLDVDAAEVDRLTWGERLALLPWRQIALWAAGTFLIALLIITAFELLAGRTVSSFTGGSDDKRGTSISQITRNNPPQETEPGQESGDEATPSPDAPSSETPATPGDRPTTTPTTEPTPNPSPEISPTPTTDPSMAPFEPEPSPSESPAPEAPTPTE